MQFERPHILIVDDDASTRRSLALILQCRGYDTAEAGTGREALACACERTFQVAILDIRLPDGLGTELFPRLQKLQPALAVIMVTGHASVKSAVETLKQGASAYIVKPVNMDAVLAEIDACLEKQRLNQENRRLAEALRKSEEEYREVVEGSNSLIMRRKPDGTITFLNRSSRDFFGYEPHDLMGRNMLGRIVPEIDSEGRDLTELVQAIGQDPDAHLVTEHENMCKGGARVWVAWQNRALRNQDGSIREILSVGINTTARRRAEREARRANHTLTTISRCNEALVRIDDEREVLDKVCRVLVQTGGYHMVWAGVSEGERDTVCPVAWAGLAPDVIATIDISWAQADGNGHRSRACGILRQAPIVCRDILADARFIGLREEARARGYASAISLPLNTDHGAGGKLFAYAREPDAFDDEEVRLLLRFADDLSHDLSSLRARTERQRLQNEILRISEKERRRIGRDLHDTIGQQLTGIAHRVDLLEEQLNAKLPAEAGEASDIRRLLDQALDQVRSMSRVLYPVRASSLGLSEALDELAAWGRTQLGISCSFECEPPVRIEGNGAAVHLCRIAQEAVNNAAKHAAPKRIEIRLKSHRDAISLEIDDDGKGMPSNGSTPRGLGLKTMQYRAEALGGTLRIGPGERGGTRVVCTVPTHAVDDEGGA